MNNNKKTETEIGFQYKNKQQTNKQKKKQSSQATREVLPLPRLRSCSLSIKPLSPHILYFL